MNDVQVWTLITLGAIFTGQAAGYAINWYRSR